MNNEHTEILPLRYRADRKDKSISCKMDIGTYCLSVIGRIEKTSLYYHLQNEHRDILPLRYRADRKDKSTVCRMDIGTSCLSFIGRIEKTTLPCVEWILGHPASQL
jgi:hypothetical protein